jgi:hypothetical protein
VLGRLWVVDSGLDRDLEIRDYPRRAEFLSRLV